MFINKRFTFLFFASLISVLGGSLSYIAVGWFFTTKEGVVLLSLLSTTYFVARFVFFLTLGPVTDRFQPKQLMVRTMVFRVLLLFFFGGLLQLHVSYKWMFLVIVFMAAAEALYFPASTKLIAKVVDQEDQSRANALLTLTDRIGVFAGMLLGATAASYMPLGLVLILEGSGYVLGAGFLLLITFQPDELSAVSTRRHFIQEWKEGLRYIGQHKWLLGLVALAVAANVAIAPAVTLLAPFSQNVLHGNAQTFSFLEMAGIVGSLLSGLILSKWRLKHLTIVFVVACACEAVLMLLFGLNSLLYTSLLILFLNGFAITLFNIPFSTLMQRYVSEHIMGRVRSSVNAVSTGASCMGYLFTGIVSEKVGVGETFVFFSLAGLLLVLAVALWRPFKYIPNSAIS